MGSLATSIVCLEERKIKTKSVRQLTMIYVQIFHFHPKYKLQLVLKHKMKLKGSSERKKTIRERKVKWKTFTLFYSL